VKRAAEALRWLMALAGLGFWLTGMSVFLAGEPARWHWRCRGRELEYACFRDGLPILDMAVPVLALLLAYPIARYVFTMWAPSPEARTLPWWPASRRGSGELLWPIGQLLAATGIVTSLWTLLVFPLAAEFWPYYLFWGASALWCALTVWIAWPQPEEREG
jgi:hypothetical protein